MTAHAAELELEPVSYERFRTGLSYQDITAELRREARQADELEGRRMFWTRHTVLGRFRQRKLEAYDGYRRWIGSSSRGAPC